jgi:hypothetical protein
MDWNRPDTLVDAPVFEKDEGQDAGACGLFASGPSCERDRRDPRPATEDPDLSGLFADLEAVAQLEAELAAGTPAEVAPPHRHPRLSTTAWDLSDSEPAPPPVPPRAPQPGFQATSTFDGRKTSVWCPPADVRATATAALFSGHPMQPLPGTMPPRPPRRPVATMLPPLPGGPPSLPPPSRPEPPAAAAPQQARKPPGVPMSYQAFRAMPHQPARLTAMIRVPAEAPRRSLLARIGQFFARLFGRAQPAR